MKAEKLVAVFDANVYIALALSKNPRSPIIELFNRLRNNEYKLAWCEAIRDEVIEKLIEKGLDENLIAQFIIGIESVVELVVIKDSDIKPVLSSDPDDDVVIACAVKAEATHLVTYDLDFDSLEGEYEEIKIVDGLHFLYELRGESQ